MSKVRLFQPGPNGQLINEYGKPEQPPKDWEFLPAGDAAITRKVTAKGEVWRVQIKRGKRLQSKGIWAASTDIKAAKKEVLSMRSDPAYERKKESAARSRTKKQDTYVKEFEGAVLDFLDFHPTYQSMALKMSQLVTAHAIPIGSGTVARTSTIPLEERAAKAVIAWMRHQTTNYDDMKIKRIKGERRSVRKKLAQDSMKLLKSYRNGQAIPSDCPLQRVLG